MKIAGRCECGMVMEWVARHPDEHMKCWGVRWCRMCHDAAPAGKRCEPCRKTREAAKERIKRLDPLYLAKRRAIQRKTMRRLLRDPRYRAKRNAQARRWMAEQRRKGAPSYERAKAHKRLRYATDLLYREEKKAAWRRWYRQNKGFETANAANRPIAPASQSAHESTAA